MVYTSINDFKTVNLIGNVAIIIAKKIMWQFLNSYIIMFCIIINWEIDIGKSNLYINLIQTISTNFGKYLFLSFATPNSPTF